MQRFSNLTPLPALDHFTPVSRNRRVRPQVHQVRRRLPAETIAALVAEYQAGTSTPALCAHYQLGKGAVLRLLQEHGVSMRGQGLDADDLPEAVQLYQEGWSLLRLAERFGCSAETVRRKLRIAGVVLRKPWER